MRTKPKRAARPWSPAARWVAVAAVVLFLIVDVVLIVFALGRVAADSPGAAGPIPTFGEVRFPAPMPTSTEPPAALASSSRYLSTSDGVTLWRSTLGSCDGSEAVIESSIDGGANWTVLSTTEMRARQVLAISVADEDTIWVIARAGDSCAVSGFASFTAGEFWESRPEAVAQFSYLDRDAADVVHLQGLPVTAPCPEPRQSMSRDGATAVVCDDVITEWNGASASWSELPLPGLVGAFPAPGGHTVAVWDDDECEGVSIRSVTSPLGSSEAQSLGCIPAESKPTAIAFTRFGGTLWAWMDSEFRVSPDGGVTW